MTKLYNFIYTTEQTINTPLMIYDYSKMKKEQPYKPHNQKKQKYTSKIRRRYHNIKQPAFDVQRK